MTTPPQGHEGCPQFLRDTFAKSGIDVIVTLGLPRKLRRKVDGMTCPHGTMFYVLENCHAQQKHD